MAKKILIIEDQKSLIQLLSARLKSAGYQVFSAMDGTTGLDQVPVVRPDLVITDLALPGMNGNVIVRILKTSGQFKSIPILMLSAFVDESMKSGVEVPADAYMPKPFEPEKLLAKVSELLSEGTLHGTK